MNKKQCNYPQCTSENINDYGACPDHYVDYTKNQVTIESLQEKIKRLAENAPTSNGDAELEAAVFSILILEEHGEYLKQQELL
jgi:hypothetical protein